MRKLFLCVLLFGWSSTLIHADDARDDFETRIRPLLVSRCVKCHGAKKQESGLRLDSRDGWMAGGSRGPAIRPGDSKASLLLRAVHYGDHDLKMPPDGKLSAREITALETWIASGAFDPRRANASTAPERMSLEDSREFWSFQPGTRPVVPQANGEDQNPVDAFIRAKRVEQGILPVGPADKRTLIRRVTFDLTG
ncbi:MAG: c-type cytochrome domain-containing protein, partial [Planctomycetota bacterium]